MVFAEAAQVAAAHIAENQVKGTICVIVRTLPGWEAVKQELSPIGREPGTGFAELPGIRNLAALRAVGAGEPEVPVPGRSLGAISYPSFGMQLGRKFLSAPGSAPRVRFRSRPARGRFTRGPARFPSGRKHQYRPMGRIRVLLADLSAVTANNRPIRHPHQSHWSSGILRVPVLVHVAREEDIAAIR